MKSIRMVFILSGVIAVASIGFAVYMMFYGPDAIHITDWNLQKMLGNEDLLPLFVIPVVLIISAFAIVPFIRILFPREIKNGITARAKILKVWDTGVSINDNPQVGLLLEVSPPGLTPFQAKAKTVVSRLNAALVQPGVEAEVRYDPDKPTRMQVKTLYILDGSSTSTADRLEELNGLRDKGLITEEEYRQKREEILKLL